MQKFCLSLSVAPVTVYVQVTNGVLQVVVLTLGL